MIIVKTKMRKFPENCKKCALSIVEHDWIGSQRVCRIFWRACPMEAEDGGNEKYTKPEWCPLVKTESM